VDLFATAAAQGRIWAAAAAAAAWLLLPAAAAAAWLLLLQAIGRLLVQQSQRWLEARLCA
jgi:hypothetical protein